MSSVNKSTLVNFREKSCSSGNVPKAKDKGRGKGEPDRIKVMSVWWQTGLKTERKKGSVGDT